MSINHLVLIGGGHSNALLLKKWIMKPSLMPNLPISIISRDSHLVYSSMYPSVIAKSIPLSDSLINIYSLAKSAQISFINSEVSDLDVLNKRIILKNRPFINYSKLVLNCGSQTLISKDFKDLVKKRIAFPIKPFFESYEFIKSEDIHNSENELPFVIVGSGLAAVEMAFALRKRWIKRRLVLVCNLEKINYLFIKKLQQYKIVLKKGIDFSYKRILLCTGNEPYSWIKNNYLSLDKKGRIMTNLDLRVNKYSDIFAVGDCACMNRGKNNYSGILAVKSSDTLVKNLIKDFRREKLTLWHPQKVGLQLVNLFNNNNNRQKTFAIYGRLKLGPSYFLWLLKSKIDRNFVHKFKLPLTYSSEGESMMKSMDCRGCAAKLPQDTLNSSFREAELVKFAEYPEDASEIFRSDKEIILQSIDGFPALISDPFLNGRITTLHACSDLWASGAKVSSAQLLISIPKGLNDYQKYLFSQSLGGIKSTLDELGGIILGGHTFESRNIPNKPYPLSIDISLTVQGILKDGQKPWRKYGMKPGDVLLMSRPLGVGIFFAAQMRNIDVFQSYENIFENLTSSQQSMIDQINIIQNQIGKRIVNASTDITGYGFLGHLKEMIDSSNSIRRKNDFPELKVLLDLSSFKAYPGIFDLIRKGIKSSLYLENKKVFEQIDSQKHLEKIIVFLKKDLLDNEYFEIIELLLDPQTCGPLLICCHSEYEKYFDNHWYKVGEVIEK